MLDYKSEENVLLVLKQFLVNKIPSVHGGINLECYVTLEEEDTLISLLYFHSHLKPNT